MYSSHRRVLLTGFGPFGTFKENPSWLAVKTLHDTVLKKHIHITTLQVPVVYKSVLEIVPGFHQAPPKLPEDAGELDVPEDGYDLIVHVGVAGPGGLLAERQAHKTGYTLPDYKRESPPLVNPKGTVRGFGPPQYGAEFADELLTSVDIDKLVSELTAGSNPVNIRPSSDPGRYLCDFIFYASLAESQRAGRGTPVLFIHCPPVGDKLSTAQVADEHAADLGSARPCEARKKGRITQFFDCGPKDKWAIVSDGVHYITVAIPKSINASTPALVALKGLTVICSRIPGADVEGLSSESFIALKCAQVDILGRCNETGMGKNINDEADIGKWIADLRRAPDILRPYYASWSKHFTAAADEFLKPTTLNPLPATPVDARDFGSSPSQQMSSPLSGWSPSPRQSDSEHERCPTPSPAPMLSKKTVPSSQALDSSYLSAPTPAQRQKRAAVDEEETSRRIHRRVSRPKSSGPTVILAQASLASQPEEERDEDDMQTDRLLFGVKRRFHGFAVPRDGLASNGGVLTTLDVPLSGSGFAAVRRSLLLVSAVALGLMSLRKPLAEWAGFVYAKGDIRSLFGLVVCSIVVLLLAYLTNPSENSFRAYLTEQSFRHHLSRLDATTSDDPSASSQRRPPASTVPFDHGSPFHFANRATVSLRTPKHVFHSFGVFTVAAIIPAPTDRRPKDANTIVTDSWFIGAFGKWYRGGVLDAWYQDVVARSSDEETWTSGIMGMKALDKMSEYDGLPFSTKNLPAARSPPKLRNRDKSSQRLPVRSSTPPPLPKSASLPLHTPRPSISLQPAVSEPNRLGSLSRSPSTLFDQSPRIAEVLQQITASRNSVLELRNQLADFQITASSSHASLQAEVDSFRERKRQEDAARSELKSRTKTLEDSKRAAESVKRDADKRLKAAQTSRDDARQRMEFLDREIDVLTQRRAQDEASLLQTQQGFQTEQDITDALDNKRLEIKASEDIIAALNQRARELEDKLSSERDRLKLTRERAELWKQDRSFQPYNTTSLWPAPRNTYDMDVSRGRRSSDPHVLPTSPRPAKLALGAISNFNKAPPPLITSTPGYSPFDDVTQHAFTNFSPFGDPSPVPLLSPTSQSLIPSGLISSLDSVDGTSRSFQSDSDAFVDKDWSLRSHDSQMSPTTSLGPLTTSPTSLHATERNPFEVQILTSPSVREREFRMSGGDPMDLHRVYRTYSDPTSDPDTKAVAPTRRWFSSNKDKAKKGLNPDAKEFSLSHRIAPSTTTTTSGFDNLNPNGLGSGLMAPPASANQSLLRAFAPSPAEREALHRALGGSTNTSLERLPSLSDVGSIPPSPALVQAAVVPQKGLPSWLSSLPRIRKPNFSPWEDEEPVAVGGSDERRFA
ncbi:Proteophosphoglycan ppg4 [Mycena chlorophos]|uniref:Proteophosphoglycan ppg4 n=1 Tax=Mycena chlorophos TaxID=658473 RepID=A0A8H6SGA3_MYCCL|nr:Proteophosphoglycan ppg4 [Mycena chlorophos]